MLSSLSLDPPGKPTSVSIPRSTDEGLTIEWKPPTSDGGARIKKYVVQVIKTYSVNLCSMCVRMKNEHFLLYMS